MNNILQKIETLPPIVLQLCRFGLIGLTAATVHFSTVILLVQYLKYQPLIANVFAFLVAFQISYWGHRLWTFGDSSVLHHVALTKLLLVQILNFAANETLFYIFLSWHLPYPIALLVVLTILPVFTFTVSKFWIFS